MEFVMHSMVSDRGDDQAKGSEEDTVRAKLDIGLCIWEVSHECCCIMRYIIGENLEVVVYIFIGVKGKAKNFNVSDDLPRFICVNIRLERICHIVTWDVAEDGITSDCCQDFCSIFVEKAS
eukprot:10287682-Ditylum_brightwellii.AAC.1